MAGSTVQTALLSGLQHEILCNVQDGLRQGAEQDPKTESDRPPAKKKQKRGPPGIHELYQEIKPITENFLQKQRWIT